MRPANGISESESGRIFTPGACANDAIVPPVQTQNGTEKI